MPQNFLPCDREQELLLPPNMRDWLAEDHFAWFVLDAVERLDLEAFYASYRRDGWGRAAHDPQMMVALLVYAYAIGERSSRAIERRCREDVAFRVIAANALPDHATIARFRVRHETALGELFGQVLGAVRRRRPGVRRCARSRWQQVRCGCVGRRDPHLRADRRRNLARGRRLDAAEDDIHGPARGDELPAHLAKREGRQAWLKDAKQRLDRERAEHAEPVSRDRDERLSVCQRRLVEDWQTERSPTATMRRTTSAACSRRGRKAMGSGPRPFTPAARPEASSTRPPDAKRMKLGRTFIPAYNAQPSRPRRRSSSPRRSRLTAATSSSLSR